MSAIQIPNTTKAKIKCFWCGRKWTGRYRENYTCSKKNGGCGGKFKIHFYDRTRVVPSSPYPEQPVKQWVADKETMGEKKQ
jgi:hypothetical protein